MEHTVVSQPKTTSRPLGFFEMLNLSFYNQSPELTCPGNKQYPRMLFVLQEQKEEMQRKNSLIVFLRHQRPEAGTPLPARGNTPVAKTKDFRMDEAA